MTARDRALRLLAGTSASGRAFLEIAAEALALGLSCPWAGFGRLCADGVSAEVLVLWSGDRLGEGFRYDLAGTPCAVPYGRDQQDPYWFCPAQVWQRFAGPPILKQIKAQSYRSEALFDSHGTLIGHVFAIGAQAEEEDPDSRAFFRLVAGRAGAEYERMLAAQALQQSEARNRDIIENLPDLVCRFRPDGTLTFVNEAYCRFFDKSRSDLIGHSFFEFIPPEDHAFARAHVNSIDRQRPEATYEHQVVAPGGEIRWQRWTDRAIFDEQGEVSELYSIGRDITEQRRALEALRASEALTRRTADMVPALIAYVGPDYRFRFVNKAYEDWFGLPRERILGATLSEVLGLEAFEQVREFSDRALAGESFSFEKRMNYERIAPRLVRGYYRPHRLDDGTTLGYVVLIQDITKEKLAEEALRKSEALVRTTADMVPALIAHVGPDLRYRFVNKAYEDWFNRPRETIIGRYLYEILSPDFYANVQPHIQRALSGEPVYFETLSATKKDEQRHVRIQYQPRTRKSGKLDGFVILVQDITDLRRTTQQLQEAKETAERINSAKSRFLAAASHDLRQPLHALRMLMAALPGVSTQERRNDILAKMSVGVESMGHMLDALLDVSELEAGTITPEITEFPVEGLFRLAASNLGMRARARGLDLRLVSSTATVHSDPALLARIIENFLSNAVRYTDRGRVLLGCRRRGDHLRIEVWDSGIGIPEDQLDEIFEEFHQLDNPARDRSKGLGLGLSIASRMADMLGHRIDVRSRPGVGSLFAVTVPRGASKPERKDAATARTPIRSLAGISMLVIENDLDVLEATRELLVDWGATVATATNCEDAVALALSTAPDLVMADYRLPGQGTGSDAVVRIRRALKTSVPAVIVTGDTEPDHLKMIESSGVPVLTKPVDTDRLRSLITMLLEDRVSAA